jgi:site-specific DNA recombinase
LVTLETESASHRIELLKRLVARITVGSELIEIVVRIAAIWLSGLSDESPIGGDEVTSIIVPVQLKRCGLAVRLIVRAALGGKTRAPDPRLVALLAKAQRWFNSLSSGRSDSVLSIAQEHGMASSEVTRVIYLAFLAPDIVERIVRGEQPVEMNIKRLLAAEPLPLDWAEQRRVLGMDGRSTLPKLKGRGGAPGSLGTWMVMSPARAKGVAQVVALRMPGPRRRIRPE